MEDVSPFRESTDTPVLDFLGHLASLSKKRNYVNMPVIKWLYVNTYVTNNYVKFTFYELKKKWTGKHWL